MTEPIRVLCVFSTLDRGGAESMCMNLYRHIDRDKVQFDFVKHTRAVGAFEEEIIALGGRIFEAPRYRVYNHYAYTRWWRGFLRMHPEHRIVHGHFFSISAIYFSVAKQLKRVTVGHSHIAKFDSKIKKMLCRHVEDLSDYRLACGVEAGKLLYPHRDFMVLNNAIDAKQFRYNEAIRRKYRADMCLNDSIVIGIVANFGYHKNPIGVIELFHRLAQRNAKYRLIWVGADGALKESVMQKIEEYGLSKRISMLGVRDDVCQLMQAMDAFILPSFYEGLPVVLIEAQAAGLRCFTSKNVTNEADITGRCAFLPLDQWDYWVNAIENANLVHADTYDAIVNAGYDIDTTARWLEDFYMKAALHIGEV